MITTTILPYEALSKDDLYQILALRSSVFVVEQSSIYQDLDFKDQFSDHILMHQNLKLIGYARILPFDKMGNMSFGRLVVHPEYRKQNLGRELMATIMTRLVTMHPNAPIIITAQHYLKRFYESYGFIAEGEPFIMDGLPHILMRCLVDSRSEVFHEKS